MELRYRMVGVAEKRERADSEKRPGSAAETEEGQGMTAMTLKLGELKELHSNGLLISGMMTEDRESKKTIQHFSEVLDMVLRFVRLFKEHWEAGNLFFSSMKSEFFFDPDQKVKASVELHPKHGKAQRLCGTGPAVLVQLEHLCDFLQKSGEQWNEFVRGIRARYPALNFYTRRQILKLREKLAVLVSDGPRSPAKRPQQLDTELEMLLMGLKADVDLDQVRRALESAQESAVQEEVAEELASREERVADIINMGYDGKLAARAILACGDDAMDDDLFEWMDNHKEDQVTEKVEDLATELLQLVEKELRRKGDQNLTEQLQRIFNAYLAQQREEQGLSREYLGLEELGRILRSLWSPSPRTFQLQPPSWVEKNRQNLVLVEEEDVLRYAYSLYHATPEVQAGFHNVFVCNPDSTSEELELFVQRIRLALSPDLYSILFIETLSPEVSSQLERSVRDLVDDGSGSSTGRRKDFGLVFFCSIHQYEKCHLAGLLTRYRRPAAEALTLVRTRSLITATFTLLDREKTTLPQALAAHSAALVTSVGYGQGKSLCVERMGRGQKHIKIPIHERSLDLQHLWTLLMERVVREHQIVHIDVSDHRTAGIDQLVFQLLLLGGFTTSQGKIWRWRPTEKYVVEMTSAANQLLKLSADGAPATDAEDALRPARHFRYNLPIFQSHSPTATLSLMRQQMSGNADHVHQTLDPDFLAGEQTRRCLEFLGVAAATAVDRLEGLLRCCGRKPDSEDGVKEPSWLELRHFVRFLGTQLASCEENIFMQSTEYLEHHEEFKKVVVAFSLDMARDFATRSLTISEEITNLASAETNLLSRLEHYEMKRHWEATPHPYLFFNPDRETFSFFGCTMQPRGAGVDLVEPKSGQVFKRRLMTKELYTELRTQLGADNRFADDLTKPFDDYSRPYKLHKLFRVLIPDADQFLHHFPTATHSAQFLDPNYEITMDNALKMLATEMRLRCHIPVVVMGETGCGKTKLLEFYCAIKRLKAQQENPDATIKNLLILRVTILRVDLDPTAGK